jgi:hypothetical protein
MEMSTLPPKSSSAPSTSQLSNPNPRKLHCVRLPSVVLMEPLNHLVSSHGRRGVPVPISHAPDRNSHHPFAAHENAPEDLPAHAKSPDKSYHAARDSSSCFTTTAESAYVQRTNTRVGVLTHNKPNRSARPAPHDLRGRQPPKQC